MDAEDVAALGLPRGDSKELELMRLALAGGGGSDDPAVGIDLGATNSRVGIAGGGVKTCSICFEDSDVGLECSEGHFHCESCLADYAQHFLAVGNTRERKQREGCLKCSKFPRECRSGFDDQDLAKHLPAMTFQDYLSGKLDARQARSIT